MKLFRKPSRDRARLKREKTLLRVERLEERQLLALVVPADELLDQSIFGPHPSSDLPAIARSADGDFVVTYSGRGPGDARGVFAERYDAAGTLQGEPFLVNQTTAGIQGSSAVALGSDGGFVVVWSGRGNGDRQGVLARRFDSDGAPLGDELLVNTTIAGVQGSPAVATTPDGGFVVVWAGAGSGDRHGVFARRFAADGTPAGDEFLVNSHLPGKQGEPAVAVAGDGSFVVTWASQGQDSSGWGIFGQRFSASGARLGSEFAVNTTTASDQVQPRIAAGSDGRFVIVWSSFDAGSGEWDIFARRFSADATPAGADFQVNNAGLPKKHQAHVAMLDGGGFLIGYSSLADDGKSIDVVAQEFDEAGNPTGESTELNRPLPRRNRLPLVAPNASGQIMVAWNGPQISDHNRVFTHQVLPEVDRQGPTIAVGLVNDTAGGSGTSADQITRDPRLRGSVTDARSGVASLTIQLQPNSLVAIPFDASGNFSFDPGLALDGSADGPYTVVLRSLDRAGNAASVSFGFTLDTSVAPPNNLQLLEQNGAVDADNVTASSRPTVRVAAESGSIVRAVARRQDNPSQILSRGEAVASNGVAVITFGENLDDGTYSVRATAEDAAGNISGESSTLLVTIRSGRPPAPSVPDLLPASDSGISNSDNITSVNTPSIRVQAQGAARVRLLRDNQVIGEAALSNGFADFTTPALGNGQHVFQAVAISDTGVESFASPSLTVTVDRIPPALPLGLDLLAASDTGASNQDNFTSAKSLALRVNVESGSRVRLFDDVTEIATITASGGVATFTTQPLADGIHIFRVTATDPAGNESAASAALVVTIDSARPTVVNGLDDVSVPVSAPNTSIDLTGAFADEDSLGRVVRFDTTQGLVDVQLYPQAAPGTVVNFSNYMARYANTLIHRVVPGFVIQGGGFRGPKSTDPIPTDPPIPNEFKVSNTRGTIAMAKSPSSPNSATSQWFINLADNSNNLNNQNGGFTVFGQVLGTSMQVADAIAGRPDDSVVVNSVSDVPLGSDRLLSFSVVGNTNPALVTPVIAGRNLTLDYADGQQGTSTITIRTTDLAGNFIEDSFTVSVGSAAPLLLAGYDGPSTPAIATAAEIAAYNPRPLSAEMEAIVREAVARWAGLGLDPAALARLDSAQLYVADLPGAYLGLALGDSVWLDSDAAGRGWYFDSNPADDEEFAGLLAAHASQSFEDEIRARVDLLSAVAHELGHVLGLADLDPADYPHELMSGTLEPGVRRLPSAAALELLFAGQ